MKRLIAILCAFAVLCTACSKTPTEPKESTEDTTVAESYLTEDNGMAPPDFDAYAMAESLSVEEKVGQLFLAGCPETNAVADIATYHLGGYFLFARDFENETPDSMVNKINLYQSTASIPLLIAADEEGGTVCRVSSYPQYRDSRFPSPRALYDQGGLDLIYETESEKCRLLQSVGVNVNASPVCDICTDPNAFMYSRSLGQDPETTGTFVVQVCDIMQRNDIGSILKHFPGYGNNVDTHVGIAVDNRTLEELESVDLVPFAMGIQAGADAIMVSHTIITAIDPENPASLSPAVIQYLREDMGFAGVIITDDLSMGAVSQRYGDGEAAVLAFLAGNDILCTWNYRTQYPAVLQAVRDGRITEEQLNQSVARILQWKYDMGMLEGLY